MTLTRAQVEHLARIIAAGGTSAIRDSPLATSHWARGCLNKLHALGLLVVTPGSAGVPPSATVTDAGRAAYAAAQSATTSD